MKTSEIISSVIGFIFGAGISIPITYKISSKKIKSKIQTGNNQTKQKNIQGKNIAGRDLTINHE